MTGEFRRLAEEMLFELENSHFEVVLIPAPERRHSGHQVRALQSANPEWYSRFASQYVNCRGVGLKRMKRPRTYIDKRATVKALERMLEGDEKGIYAERLLNFMSHEIARKTAAARPHVYDPNKWLAVDGTTLFF